MSFAIAAVIEAVIRDYAAAADGHCDKLAQKLSAIGVPRDRINYEVAKLRQDIVADSARRITALRRDCLRLVN